MCLEQDVFDALCFKREMSMTRLKFKPKYEKIVELLLYMAHKRPSADHYQAVKFLYLADIEHLNRHGRPITYEKYSALPYGPVASNAYDLLKDPEKGMKKFGIKKLPFRLEKLGTYIYIREPLRPVSYDLFSKSDLNIFDEVLTKHGHKSFGELYDMTHAHFAYKKAWENKPEDKKSGDMRYEDMMEESPIKASYIEEISVVAEHMQ